MKFIDRSAEMKRLDGLVSAGEPGLVVLWGRRRIGKTRLLLEWCVRHRGLYTVADQSSEAIQRRYFAEAVDERIPGFAEVTYPDWRALLRRLSHEARRMGWSGPLVFDEFPHLVSSSTTLASIFQNWIDHEAKAAGLLVAIAGSSQRMMQGLVLNGAAPLYGRSLEAIELQPLPPGYIAGALGLDDPVQAVQSFAVWGGVPRYWELAERYRGALEDAVDDLVLDPMGPLHSEPDRLLLEETPPATPLRPILDAIGAGAHRPSEIAGRVGQPVTSLGRPLSRLLGMQLVEREVPFGESEKSSRRALYRIADPFFRFWFRVVAPQRAAMARSPKGVRRAIWRRAAAALFAETWESLCRRGVSQLAETSASLAAIGPWGPAARMWGGNSPEWDVVAVSLDRRHLLLGEAKWRLGTGDAVADAAQELMRKGVPALKGCEKCQPVYAVFVPRRPAKSSPRISSIHVVDAREVMSALRMA